LHLYLIIVLTEVIAIVFVFENFIVFVIVFKYYAMYLDPSLMCICTGMYECTYVLVCCIKMFAKQTRIVTTLS